MSRVVSWIALAVGAIALILSLIGPSNSEKSSDVVQKSDFYEVRDRLDALEANMGELVSRLEEAANGGGNGAPIQIRTVPAANDGKSQKQLESLNREIASLRSQIRSLENSARTAPPAPDGNSDEFRGAVATAQQEIRRERMRTHMERVEQMRLSSMEDFAQKEGLNSDQTEGLRRIIAGETEFAQLISGLGENSNGEMMGFAERREKMESHRENLRGELEHVLGSADLAQRFQQDVIDRMGSRLAPPPPARRQ